jgi:hypothetical protein
MKMCSQCKIAMDPVTRVAPTKLGPALVVWRCPHCNGADSEIIYGDLPEAGGQFRT